MSTTFFDKEKVSAVEFHRGKGGGPSINLTVEDVVTNRIKSVFIPSDVFQELMQAGFEHFKDKWPIAIKRPAEDNCRLDFSLLSHFDLSHLMIKGITDLPGFKKTRTNQLILENEGIGQGCDICKKIAQKLGLKEDS